MATKTLIKVPLRIKENGDPGFVVAPDGMGRELVVVTDQDKELKVKVPKEKVGTSLEAALADFSVIEFFKDDNIGFYQHSLFQDEVNLSLLPLLGIRGETWLGVISFASERFQPIYWRAVKTWDNPVFLRGGEVEHSERIYAEPRSVAGWEIRIGLPIEMGHDDLILRRHLATLVESTIAVLESGKPAEFPLRRIINNVVVRRPHRVNLPYIVGLGENVYPA